MGKRLVVAVAGSTGVGKTFVACRLAKHLKAGLIDLKKYAVRKGLVDGVDGVRDAFVVDGEKLSGVLSKDLSKKDGDVVLDGILSPYAPATHIVVLRCSPKKLLSRLRTRGYKKTKIVENLEAEVLGVCRYDSLWCKNVLEIDATDGVDVDAIVRWIPKGGRKLASVDWFRVYARMLSRGF
jgi:adenylate kinase